MSNSSVIDGDLYSSMCGESSSSVDDAQYCADIIGEHVYKPDVPVQLIPFKGLIFKSLKLAIKMYYEYAEIGGFDVKLTTTPNYKAFQFDEFHNHPLEKKSDLKKARQMSYSEKEFIVRASTSKIGPTMAHKLRESLRVNTMNDCQAHYLNYSFDFNCQDDVLDCMFWADEMEKAYYAEFSDVISFDVTFRTNKYRMVFVPFTAIDHHKKSITVGAGLLSNESIESYSLLFKAFLKTHKKEPTLVSTDQDASIKQAIENVFANSKHRLCMWHTMKKFKNKISDDLFTNTNFRKRFSKLVWDVNMKPDVFEVKWGLLMKEFNLEDMRWFKDMFTKRDSWIPGYFNDIAMCGLMKTTSRSDSINSFFNTYLESGNSLLLYVQC
ncbi:hypothetical protein Lser_V15G14290 [Lactuca serriola]